MRIKGGSLADKYRMGSSHSGGTLAANNEMSMPTKTCKSRRGKSPVLRLFDAVDLVNHINEQAQIRMSLLLPHLKLLAKSESFRKIATVEKNIVERLKTLKVKFPNFTIVIDRYCQALALAALSSPAAIYLPPLLLVGEPGIGKTRFLRELAAVLAIDFFNTDMSSVSAGFVLGGGSTGWHGGKPGLIADFMRKSEVANPIILLDEIDKVSGSSQHDPLSCMYVLLEKHTAKEFVDEALTLKMDCSLINWVASANYIDQIPAPIRSRFTVVNVAMPTTEQMPAIIRSVFEDLLAEHDWGQYFSKELTLDVIEKMLGISPRKQKQTLLDACAHAAAMRKPKRKGVLLTLLADEIVIEDDLKRFNIGFIN